uniref:Uncharacterized protein n=1 Tax=Pinctada fucata TaxID=50426 RepID=A0A194AML8_PINFU
MQTIFGIFLLSAFLMTSQAADIECIVKCTYFKTSPHCDCHQIIAGERLHHNHHHSSTVAPSTITITTPSTMPSTTLQTATLARLVMTTHICDHLCEQQLGGEACHCSKPGLPGEEIDTLIVL